MTLFSHFSLYNVIHTVVMSLLWVIAASLLFGHRVLAIIFTRFAEPRIDQWIDDGDKYHIATRWLAIRMGLDLHEIVFGDGQGRSEDKWSVKFGTARFVVDLREVYSYLWTLYFHGKKALPKSGIHFSKIHIDSITANVQATFLNDQINNEPSTNNISTKTASGNQPSEGANTTNVSIEEEEPRFLFQIDKFIFEDITINIIENDKIIETMKIDAIVLKKEILLQSHANKDYVCNMMEIYQAWKSAMKMEIFSKCSGKVMSIAATSIMQKTSQKLKAFFNPNDNPVPAASNINSSSTVKKSDSNVNSNSNSSNSKAVNSDIANSKSVTKSTGNVENANNNSTNITENLTNSANDSKSSTSSNSTNNSTSNENAFTKFFENLFNISKDKQSTDDNMRLPVANSSASNSQTTASIPSTSSIAVTATLATGIKSETTVISSTTNTTTTNVTSSSTNPVKIAGASPVVATAVPVSISVTSSAEAVGSGGSTSTTVISAVVASSPNVTNCTTTTSSNNISNSNSNSAISSSSSSSTATIQSISGSTSATSITVTGSPETVISNNTIKSSEAAPTIDSMETNPKDCPLQNENVVSDQ